MKRLPSILILVIGVISGILASSKSTQSVILSGQFHKLQKRQADIDNDVLEESKRVSPTSNGFNFPIPPPSKPEASIEESQKPEPPKQSPKSESPKPELSKPGLPKLEPLLPTLIPTNSQQMVGVIPSLPVESIFAQLPTIITLKDPPEESKPRPSRLETLVPESAPQPEKKSDNLILYICIGAGILFLILMVSFIAYRKSRRNKKKGIAFKPEVSEVYVKPHPHQVYTQAYMPQQHVYDAYNQHQHPYDQHQYDQQAFDQATSLSYTVPYDGYNQYGYTVPQPVHYAYIDTMGKEVSVVGDGGGNRASYCEHAGAPRDTNVAYM